MAEEPSSSPSLHSLVWNTFVSSKGSLSLETIVSHVEGVSTGEGGSVSSSSSSSNKKRTIKRKADKKKSPLHARVATCLDVLCVLGLVKVSKKMYSMNPQQVEALDNVDHFSHLLSGLQDKAVELEHDLLNTVRPLLDEANTPSNSLLPAATQNAHSLAQAASLNASITRVRKLQSLYMQNPLALKKLVEEYDEDVDQVHTPLMPVRPVPQKLLTLNSQIFNANTVRLPAQELKPKFELENSCRALDFQVRGG